MNNKLSGAQPTTTTGNFTGHVNSRISVMGQPFNAKCDGTTDDTAAIQSAINYVFRNTGTHYTLYFPRSPNGCRVSSLDLTNLTEANIEGEAPYGGFSSFIRCQEATNNTGICADFTGSHNVTIKNLRIHANNGDNSLGAPRIAVLMAKSCASCNTEGGNSQIISWDNVSVRNVGGDYAVYNFGGEVWHAHHSFFEGGNIADILLSQINTAAITSSFTTIGPSPTSMTQVDLMDNVYSVGPGAGIVFDGGTVSDIKVDGGYANTAAGVSFVGDLGLQGGIFNLNLSDIRQEPQGNNTTSTFAKFTAQVENFVMLNDKFAPLQANTVPPVQFNNPVVVSAAGGIINIRPGDQQNTYPASTIGCTSSAGVQFMSVDAVGGGPLLNTCPGLVTCYSGGCRDLTQYAGSGANAIPACSASTINDHLWVSDGATGCTYQSTYAAGAGSTKCPVGCDGTNWKYGS